MLIPTGLCTQRRIGPLLFGVIWQHQGEVVCGGPLDIVSLYMESG